MASRKKSARPGPIRRVPRAEKAALKRKAIVDAALEEFAEKGFANARMEDVARRAKVGKGTVYLYFKDKQALFEGLVHEFIATPLGLAKDIALQPGQDVGDFLRQTFPPTLALVANSRRGDVLRLLIGEGARFPKLADSYRKQVLEPMIGRMRRLLTYAHTQGKLKNPALLEFPQLLVAPGLVAIVWNRLFAQAIPLDVEAMFRAHLDILFPKD